MGEFVYRWVDGWMGFSGRREEGWMGGWVGGRRTVFSDEVVGFLKEVDFFVQTLVAFFQPTVCFFFGGGGGR